jgi:hypothetical protein
MYEISRQCHPFPNPQSQLRDTFGLQVGQPFMQVKTYITDEGINVTDVSALITVLEMAFRDPDCVVTAE